MQKSYILESTATILFKSPRFTDWCQVLREFDWTLSLGGGVERGGVGIALTYKNIEQGVHMNVDLKAMTNLGCYVFSGAVMTFIVKVFTLQSQALSSPRLECTLITVQVFCPSTESLQP